MRSRAKRYDILDVAKFICAWMVVVIHTTPLKPYSQIADLLTAQGVCRIAVPCFFAISAYLLFGRFTENHRENTAKIKCYCKRILVLYVIWSVVYTLGYCIVRFNHISLGVPFVMERIRLWILEASWYHLWYLLATVYAVPVMYMVYLRGGLLALRIIVPLMWTMRCLQYTYSWLGIFRPVFNWLQQHCDAVNNVLFCAVPLMSVGILVIHRDESRTNRYWGKRAALWSGIYLLELVIAFILSQEKIHFEFLFSTPVLTYYVLCWLVTLEFSFQNKQIPRLLRDCSIWLYCIHPLFILLWDTFVGTVEIWRFLAVVLCCAASALGYVTIKRRKDGCKCV